VPDVLAAAELPNLAGVLLSVIGDSPGRKGPLFLHSEVEPSGWQTDDGRDAVSLVAWVGEPSLDDRDRSRVFSADFEVAWERIDQDRFRVTYIGPEPAPPGLRVLERLPEGQTARYLLWGTRSARAAPGTAPKRDGQDAHATIFLEGRLPHALSYPLAATTDEAALQTVEYRDPETGVLLAFRFAGVVDAG
jgi:hypothetical protein